MTLKFNLEIFGKCLQGLGQGLMQGGILMNTTRMIHRGGMYGGSIWGCGTFMPWGCTPPLNIWHPMYADNTTNPYLIQQGNDFATAQAKQIFDQAYEYYKKQEQQFGPQFPPTETDINTATQIGKEINSAINKENGQYSITTSLYSSLFQKENKTDSEKEHLNSAYKVSVKTAGESYMNYIDTEHGNADRSLSKDEFTDYMMSYFCIESAEQLSPDQKELLSEIFNKLNLNDDGKISIDELSAFIQYVDTVEDDKKDGKITASGFDAALRSFTTDENIKPKLQSIHVDLYSE